MFSAVFSDFAFFQSNFAERKLPMKCLKIGCGTPQRAIDTLRTARDEIELAARPPGNIVVISRQTAESILDALGLVARAIRKMAECGHE
jgi:hypothetical protein